jgi:hypothetical protein
MKSKTLQIIESTLNEQNPDFPDLIIVHREGTQGMMVYSKKDINQFKTLVLPNEEGPEYDELYEIENNPEYKKIEELY